MATTERSPGTNPYPSGRESSASAPSERGKWMALTAALLGWMFDGLEMGLFPLVARPALKDLLHTTNDGDVGRWIGVVTAGFLVGAATGGVLFGWLGDRIGRVRAMMLSVFMYAFFTGLCGVADSAWQVFGFRFIAALGMGGEWSLGVALVMEIWPNRSRGFLAGLIGAAANVGYLLIALVGMGLNRSLVTLSDWAMGIGLPKTLVENLFANSGWRFLMILGAAPALLTFMIRLFVPESDRWQRERGEGSTSNWAAHDLLGVLAGLVGPLAIIYIWADDSWAASLGSAATLLLRVVVTIFGLGVAVVGYTFPVFRYLQRSGLDGSVPRDEMRSTLRSMLISACLGGIALLGTWGSMQWAAPWADKLTEGKIPDAKSLTQAWSSVGAIIGTILAALVGSRVGRRPMYCALCLASLASAMILFQCNDRFGNQFLASVFLAGMCTASFYGWLPLYLPELFRTRIRATGQGFGFNFGRILAAIGALQTGNLMQYFEGSYPKACMITSTIYLLGLVVIWFAPETHGKPLPD